MAEREEETPPLLRTLMEVIAAQLQMTRGQWRLELNFHDGRLQDVYRHDERMPPGALERFETQPG